MSVGVPQALHSTFTVVPACDIALLSGATLALAQADTLAEIKDLRDKAEAVRKYARTAALGQAVQNHAAELKLRAERKAGELLRSLRLRGGDRKSSSRDANVKLQDLGINKDQSARWQLQSRLPLEEFETYLRTSHEAGRDIASADVLRLASSLVRRGPKSQVVTTQARKVPARHNKTSTSQATPGCEERLCFPEGDRRNFFGDALEELQNHRDLLESILRPVYAELSTSIELQPAERRVVGRLLGEMRSLVGTLKQDR